MDGATWWMTICPSKPPIKPQPKKKRRGKPQLERDRFGSEASAWKRTDGERKKYERMRELNDRCLREKNEEGTNKEMREKRIKNSLKLYHIFPHALIFESVLLMNVKFFEI